ncbi:hypothetical protein MTP99_008986 [Tenebrio molitor]|nr:hypothetical protein MTP99_008986 [Tenebrio molitor]
MRDERSSPPLHSGGKEWKFTASSSRSILTYSPVYSVCCEGNKHRSRPGSAISPSYSTPKGRKKADGTIIIGTWRTSLGAVRIEAATDDRQLSL